MLMISGLGVTLITYKTCWKMEKKLLSNVNYHIYCNTKQFIIATN